MSTTTIDSPHARPLTFLGRLALLYGVALLPAAILSAHTLLSIGMPLVWTLALISLSFPALLFPGLPAASRTLALQAAGWTQALIALPAVILGLLLCQLALIETYEEWHGLLSWTRLGFGIAAFIAGALLMFWPKPPRTER